MNMKEDKKLALEIINNLIDYLDDFIISCINERRNGAYKASKEKKVLQMVVKLIEKEW